MSKAPESTTPRRTPWAWLLVGLPLGSWAYYSIFEELRLSWEPTWFLVLLGAWLGGEYGWRAMKPMLLLGVCAVFSFYDQHFGETLTIGYGFAPPEYLLGVFACAAFARNRDGWPASTDALVYKWWPLALWLATLLLAVSAFRGTKIEVVSSDTVAWTWDPAAMFALAILMSPVRWATLLQRLRPHVSVTLAIILLIAAVAALCLNVRRSGDEIVGFDIGAAYSDHWLVVLSFVATSARLMDWRLLIGLLLGVFLGTTLIGNANEGLQVVPLPFSDDPDAEVFLTWYALIHSICAALLGVVFRPFLLNWEIAPIRLWRTAVFLGAVLTLHYAVVPFYSPPGYARDHVLILGGVAFIGALVWRGKGLVALPLLILLGAVVAYPLVSDSLNGDLLGRLLRVAGLIFPFAFLGLLANRYECASPASEPEGVHARPLEVSP